MEEKLECFSFWVKSHRKAKRRRCSVGFSTIWACVPRTGRSGTGRGPWPFMAPKYVPHQSNTLRIQARTIRRAGYLGVCSAHLSAICRRNGVPIARLVIE